jgi:hypothetical protein
VFAAFVFRPTAGKRVCKHLLNPGEKATWTLGAVDRALQNHQVRKLPWTTLLSLGKALAAAHSQ